MADAEIVQLKNERGNQVYPVTTGEAIKVGDKYLEELIVDQRNDLQKYVVDKLKEMFPIGSIYTSFNDVSLGSILPGTKWSKITDGHYLRASDVASKITLPAGIPNIKGSFVVATASNKVIYSDAFRGGFDSYSESKIGSTGGDVHHAKYTLDASTVSSVYRNDVSTVQPKSLKVYMWYRVE